MQDPLNRVVIIQRIATFASRKLTDIVALPFVNVAFSDTIKNYALHLFANLVRNDNLLLCRNLFIRALQGDAIWLVEVLVEFFVKRRSPHLLWQEVTGLRNSARVRSIMKNKNATSTSAIKSKNDDDDDDDHKGEDAGNNDDSCTSIAAVSVSAALLAVCAQHFYSHNYGYAFADQTQHTPLGWATQNVRKEVVRILIENKFPVNLYDYKGFSAFHHAVISGDEELVKMFLDASKKSTTGNKEVDKANNSVVKINSVTVKEESPLLLAVKSFVLQLNLREASRQRKNNKNSQEQDEKDNNDNKAFLLAVKSRLNIIKMIVETPKCDLLAKDDLENNICHILSECNHKIAGRLLRSFLLSQTNENNNNNNHLDAIDSFFAEHENIFYIKDEDVRSALCLDDRECRNDAQFTSNTPLHIACAKQNEEAVKVFLELFKKHNPNLQTQEREREKFVFSKNKLGFSAFFLLLVPSKYGSAVGSDDNNFNSNNNCGNRMNIPNAILETSFPNWDSIIDESRLSFKLGLSGYNEIIDNNSSSSRQQQNMFNIINNNNNNNNSNDDENDLNRGSSPPQLRIFMDLLLPFLLVGSATTAQASITSLDDFLTKNSSKIYKQMQSSTNESYSVFVVIRDLALNDSHLFQKLLTSVVLKQEPNFLNILQGGSYDQTLLHYLAAQQYSAVVNPDKKKNLLASVKFILDLKVEQTTKNGDNDGDDSSAAASSSFALKRNVKTASLGHTVIHDCVFYADDDRGSDLLELLLEKNISAVSTSDDSSMSGTWDIEAKNKKGDTPVLVAARALNYRHIIVLHEKFGANLRCENSSGSQSSDSVIGKDGHCGTLEEYLVAAEKGCKGKANEKQLTAKIEALKRVMERK